MSANTGNTSGKISVLVVGAGSIGERHARCFLSTGRANVWLCEVNESLRNTVAERYGIEKSFASLADALAQTPEAVVIATPANLHVKMTADCLRAGCHVLVEKPLSISTDGVDELLRLAESSRRVVTVGYTYRSHPALHEMRDAVRSGRFGEPLEVVATCGQNFAFYRPAYRNTYYRDRATGGGAVQDALTHILNAAQWIVGMPERLVADLDHQRLEGVEVEDTVHVITRRGRLMGSFTLNQYQPASEFTLTVIGSDGMARFEFHNQRWRSKTAPDGEWTDYQFGTPDRDYMYVRQAEHFLAAIEGREEPLCSLAEGAATLDTNLAILRSASQRAWVAVRES
jgi:predicted dehydrogenase